MFAYFFGEFFILLFELLDEFSINFCESFDFTLPSSMEGYFSTYASGSISVLLSSSTSSGALDWMGLFFCFLSVWMLTSINKIIIPLIYFK